MSSGRRGRQCRDAVARRRTLRRAVVALAVLLVACAGSPQPGIDGSAPTPAAPEEAGAPEGPGGSERGVLLLSGTIDLAAETADLGAARRLPSRRDADASDRGPFRLSLEDEHGDEAATVDFEPPEPSPDDGALVAHFDLRITEALPPLTRATVSYRGQVLGMREAGPAVPTVGITSPADGEDVPYRDAAFAWAGSDDDGDDLVYSILLSLDGGETWRSLLAATERTEITLEPGSTTLQRSVDARLLVSVSDGLNSTWVESEPFRIR